MGHLSVRSGYAKLTERLNRFPQGAPPSPLLDRILGVLMSPEEAELLSKVPIKPFRPETAAERWQVPLAEARKTLDALAARAILLDLEREGRPLYVLPPPMAGFFEFSLMRVRQDVDQHLLAQLLYEYLNVEEDFVRELFARGTTQLGRAFVQERALPPALSLSVLDHERSTHVIRQASAIGVGVCYCRHKMEHVGRACDAPRNICMTFGNTARSLVKHGFARAAEKEEALGLLAEAQDRGLVQFGENVRERPAFLCHCCGCCCEAMLAARKFGFMHPVHTTRYLAVVDHADCNGCGKCVKACPVASLHLESGFDPRYPRKKRAMQDPDRCLGCGVCVSACDRRQVRLEERAERVLTPVDTVHRVVQMAIERGQLQDLVFENQAHLSHRVMAAILGAILRLPPLKQALASEQLRSRYLEALIRRSPATAPAPRA